MRITRNIPIGDPAYLRSVAECKHNIVADMAYNQPWEYWDRLQGNANTAVGANLLFFQVQQSGTKAIQFTNLNLIGQLPPPERALVTAMRFFFANMDQADQANFQYNAVAQMYVGKDIYAEGPLHLFPGGSGLAGFTTFTTRQTVSNGQPDPNAINKWGQGGGVPIGINQSFRVLVQTTAFTTATNANGGVGYDVTCIFDAIRAREVG